MDFLRLCWRDLWRNRRRSLLTGLVMGFAVMAMVAFVALNDGSHRQMIESATDTLLGHAQVQHAGFRDEPDLDHRIPPAQLELLRPVLDRQAGVRSWAPRLISGGLLSRKTRGERDDAGDASADVAAEPSADSSDAAMAESEASTNAEGAVVLGVEPERERRVSLLAASVLPDVPGDRCLRGCRAALDELSGGDDRRCEAACRTAREGFGGDACASLARELCGGPCPAPNDDEGASDRACLADACREAFADYCEPARFLAPTTPAPDQPWRGEALLGSGLARVLGVGVGDRVALTTGTAEGRTFASLYRVAGVVHCGSSDVNRTMLITHLDKLAAGLDVPGAATSVVLAVDRAGDAPVVAAALDERLASSTPILRAWSWRELSPELYVLILLDSASLLVTLILVVMVVGVILMNVVTMTVMERTREYGVRLALGESPARLMRCVLTETLLLALVFGAIGATLGEGLTWLLHEYGVDLGVDQIEVAGVLGNAVIYGDFSVFGVVFSLATVTGFSVLGALYPAWRIHRLSPVAALRFT
jgi:ABC-type lipoprotein release transport system permease subunit